MVVFVTFVVIDGGVCHIRCHWWWCLSHLLTLVMVVFVTFVVIGDGGVCHICCHW